ncbi:MAG: glycosyl transferase group 1 [Parcubacteria group bacterium Gr01-1014_38]|nr:MAG: glycosyl transferase group 1 [Parcubacteria group bacterium Gr01-1014_38]
MQLALVHESLTTLGGAERVLVELIAAFPGAPVYTLETRLRAPFLPPEKLTTSFLQGLPRVLRRSRAHLPLFPIAAETFDLSAYDVVVSSASGFAKGIVTRPGTLHICYCHSPTRFLWDAYHELLEEFPSGTIRRGLFQTLMHGLRLWDRAAARRVDLFLANSETTRAGIQKYYRREAAVLPPPLSQPLTPRAAQGESDPRRYFLFVSRLSPYKGVRVVLDTFNKLELPLVVVGEGREATTVRRLQGPTISFRGFVPDEELVALYAGARAVLFPSDDDFGLVPIEAMAQGTPVLALRRGGATETVVEGITGEFFDAPIEELLADCVRRFLENEGSYDRETIRAHAARFAAERFRQGIRAFVADAWNTWQRREVRIVSQSGFLR